MHLSPAVMIWRHVPTLTHNISLQIVPHPQVLSPKYSFLEFFPRSHTSRAQTHMELKLATQSNDSTSVAQYNGHNDSFQVPASLFCNGEICSKEKMFPMTLWPKGVSLKQKTENEFVHYFLLSTRKVVWLVRMTFVSLFNISLLYIFPLTKQQKIRKCSLYFSLILLPIPQVSSHKNVL